MEETSLEQLKQEATELGITFNPTIGAAKLQEKIAAYYASQETDTVEQAIAEKTATVQPVMNTKINSIAEAVNARRREAETKKVVTIIDNDQRVNNQTTTCIVNCSNMYFDLGTIILPLNMPVEVRQGHLTVLKELQIPQHVKNSSGLSETRMIPRYSIVEA